MSTNSAIHVPKCGRRDVVLRYRYRSREVVDCCSLARQRLAWNALALLPCYWPSAGRGILTHSPLLLFIQLLSIQPRGMPRFVLCVFLFRLVCCCSRGVSTWLSWFFRRLFFLFAVPGRRHVARSRPVRPAGPGTGGRRRQALGSHHSRGDFEGV